MENFVLSRWKNGTISFSLIQGLSGKYARTYVDGTFATGTQRYERRVLNELMVDYSTNLYIGVAPDHGNGGYFKGIIDDVRLYNKGFGSEDVYHLYRGDPAVVDYVSPRTGAKYGSSGSLSIVTLKPAYDYCSQSLLWEEISGLDLGESPS